MPWRLSKCPHAFSRINHGLAHDSDTVAPCAIAVR